MSAASGQRSACTVDRPRHYPFYAPYRYRIYAGLCTNSELWFLAANSDRLPDVEDLIARQNRMHGRSQFLGFGLPSRRYGLNYSFAVLGSKHGDHSRHVTGCRSIDRRDMERARESCGARRREACLAT